LDIYASVPDWLAVRERALEVAERAVTLAPDLGMAQTSLGWARTRLADWENAEVAFQAAIELSPGYATAHQWYADLLRFIGRADESVVEAERAVGADPVSPIVRLDLGWALLTAERVEEAVEEIRRAIELDPAWPRGWRDLLFALLDAESYEDAREAGVNWTRLNGADSVTTRQWVDSVARYEEVGFVQAFPLPVDYPLGASYRAGYYASTGQSEEALEIIRSLVEEGDDFGVAAIHVPGSRGTRDLLGDDPRYQALLHEAGITW
jgi:tetratricopeptide (TPR) repeat protein